MANRFPLTVNSSTKTIEELSNGDNLNLSGSGIYDGTTVGNTGDFLRKKSGGGVEWSSVAPGSIPVPVASETTLGGIKVGQNLTIDSNGVLHSNLDCYLLPVASSTILGGVKIGTGLTINPITGVLNAQTYTLPIASSTTLGGIKLGTGLSVSGDGTVNVVSTSIPTANASTLGGIKVGTGLGVTGDGVLSLSAATGSVLGGIKVGNGLTIDNNGVLTNSYSLPTAGASTLGGVKIGSGLNIDGNGVLSLSLPTAGASTLGGVKIGSGLNIDGNGVLSIASSVVGLASRTTASYTTGTLAPNASDGNASFTGFKTYALLKIYTSAAAWVTIYADNTSRSSDASRPDSIDPLPGSGVIAEVITTGQQTVLLTPGTFGFNNDSTPSTSIYAKIVNKASGNEAITVTLTLLKLEA